jgi:hypothetical protein
VQVTEVNKVIGLVLTGSVAVGLLSFSAWGQVTELLKGEALFSAPSLVVPLGEIFLAVCVALGAAVEGLAGMTLRRWLLTAASSLWFARIFPQGGVHQGFRYWHERFVLRASESAVYSQISDDIRYHAPEIASAMVLTREEEHVFKWYTSHYSTGLFATNLAFLTGAFCIAVPLMYLFGAIGKTSAVLAFVTAVLVLHSLCSFAIQKLLYAYELSFRMLCIEMAVPPAGDSDSRSLTDDSQEAESIKSSVEPHK